MKTVLQLKTKWLELENLEQTTHRNTYSLYEQNTHSTHNQSYIYIQVEIQRTFNKKIQKPNEKYKKREKN